MYSPPQTQNEEKSFFRSGGKSNNEGLALHSTRCMCVNGIKNDDHKRFLQKDDQYYFYDTDSFVCIGERLRSQKRQCSLPTFADFYQCAFYLQCILEDFRNTVYWNGKLDKSKVQLERLLRL